MSPSAIRPRRIRIGWALLWLWAGTATAQVSPANEAAPPEAAPAESAAVETAPVEPVEEAAPAPSDPALSGPVTQELEEALGDTVDPLDQVERQIDAREFEAPIEWLNAQVADLEQHSHRFDPRLVRPLILLGDAYVGQGLYQDALGNYQRALHLSRVNNGLNAPDQVEIVYREADVLKALGQFQDANDREEYAYHVLTRAHNPNDEALLPGIYHLARWYERTNNVFAARALYQRAGNILEANDKLDTPEAIPALRGIATTHRQERFPPFYGAELENDPTSVVTTNTMRQTITVNNFPEGEAALQRIVRIRQAEVPQDPMAVAEAVLDLADWYTLFDKMSRADPLYNHAWEIMAGIDSFDVVGHFADPALLYFPAPGGPSPPPVAHRGERSTGYVEVAFHVTEDGYVRDLNTVASQPDGLMDFRVRKSLRLARFRPVLVNGVPIARDSFTYRHEFPYYPQVESADDSASSATTAAATPGR